MASTRSRPQDEGPAASEQDDGTATLAACAGLEMALKARAPSLHASTPVVRRLAVKVAQRLGLEDRDTVLADLAAQVRDIGMVALPDHVVLNTGALSPEDWEALNRHPALGAELLAALPATERLARIVRSHHERWDGDGYPDGLRREAVPLVSRVIAVCDAFVAIAGDRPHRRGTGAEAALEHVRQQGGSQFDPQCVEALVAVVAAQAGPSEPDRDAVRRRRFAARQRGPSRQREPSRGVNDESDLRRALRRFEVLPAFGPARERMLAATERTNGHDQSELVATTESDTGLTVAILRRAQQASGRRAVTSVSDAVAALTPSEIREAVSSLPPASFPWRTPLEALMHQSRVHAQAAARAADRIGQEINPGARDELFAAVLLHDIGKLVLFHASRGYNRMSDPGSAPPEERIRRERRELGTDHASLGGLLLHRWGLAQLLVDAVAAHHRSDADSELATLVRLADMIAHQAQGNPVDRRVMLRLANGCGFDVKALRDTLFDLPHAGGSQRRRATPSPLSDRETEVLRLLAQGKVYKQIGQELGLSPSTVRSHLHHSYEKLQVADRAQAVLKVTEMAWI